MVAKPRGSRSAARSRQDARQGPSPVIATVCSKWAASEPSAVEIDQLVVVRASTSGPPAVIIGSIASVMPSRAAGRGPARRSSGSAGPRGIERPTPWPTRLRTTEKPALLDHRLHGVRDVADAVAGTRLLDPGRERGLARVEQPLRLGVDLADRERVGASRRSKPSSVTPTSTETMSPSSSRYAPGMPWTTIVVRRDADRGRVAAVAHRGRDAAVRADELLGDAVELGVVTPGSSCSPTSVDRVGDDLAGARHLLDLARRSCG